MDNNVIIHLDKN